MYRLSPTNNYRVEIAAKHAKLKSPRAFWDSSLQACVSGYDGKGRRIRLSARTVRELLGALRDAQERGGF